MKNEEAGSAFPLYMLSKSLPSTFKVILDIVAALSSFKILPCTLFHLILTTHLEFKFYGINFILMDGGIEVHTGLVTC